MESCHDLQMLNGEPNQQWHCLNDIRPAGLHNRYSPEEHLWLKQQHMEFQSSFLSLVGQ